MAVALPARHSATFDLWVSSRDWDIVDSIAMADWLDCSLLEGVDALNKVVAVD